MLFHPEKCTTIHIIRKRKPAKADYQLHGHTLESVPGGKYLGVYISDDLSWRDHINQTAAKAHRSVGFLRRNLRSCPRDVKAQAYILPLCGLSLNMPLQYGTLTNSSWSNNWRTYNARQPDSPPEITTRRILDAWPACYINWSGSHCNTEGPGTESSCSIRLPTI